jgi:hypothetical protein
LNDPTDTAVSPTASFQASHTPRLDRSDGDKKSYRRVTDRSFVPTRPERAYRFFFLWRFLRRRFFRLCVAILCRFRLRPQGMTTPLEFVLLENRDRGLGELGGTRPAEIAPLEHDASSAVSSFSIF